MQEANPTMPAEAPPRDADAIALPPVAGAASQALSDPRALQILSTEHWSLLATRSLAYNEAFSRAGMFLTFLSASLIVIGFLVGSQGLTPAVVPIAVILLLADLYIGTATVGRLIDANAEELTCVRGMNRIRHAYRDMVPGIEPYFVSGFHDDLRGVLAAYGDTTASNAVLGNVIHGLTTMIGMVATVVAMIIGALCALIAFGLGAAVELSLVLALVGFVAGTAVFARIGMRTAIAQQEGAESRFPTPG